MHLTVDQLKEYDISYDVLIDVVSYLNDSRGGEEYIFSLCISGYTHQICMYNYPIWSSEDDEREYDEENDCYAEDILSYCHRKVDEQLTILNRGAAMGVEKEDG